MLYTQGLARIEKGSTAAMFFYLSLFSSNDRRNWFIRNEIRESLRKSAKSTYRNPKTVMEILGMMEIKRGASSQAWANICPPQAVAVTGILLECLSFALLVSRKVLVFNFRSPYFVSKDSNEVLEVLREREGQWCLNIHPSILSFLLGTLSCVVASAWPTVSYGFPPQIFTVGLLLLLHSWPSILQSTGMFGYKDTE